MTAIIVTVLLFLLVTLDISEGGLALLLVIAALAWFVLPVVLTIGFAVHDDYAQRHIASAPVVAPCTDPSAMTEAEFNRCFKAGRK